MEWRNLPFWISMQCKNNTGKRVPCHIEKVAAALNNVEMVPRPCAKEYSKTAERRQIGPYRRHFFRGR